MLMDWLVGQRQNEMRDACRESEAIGVSIAWNGFHAINDHLAQELDGLSFLRKLATNVACQRIVH